MQEILRLEKKEQIKIRATSEPYTLQVKKNNLFVSVHRDITNLLGKGSKYKEEIWCLITATSKTLRYDSSFFNIPLNPNRYSEANKKYKQKLSYSRMIELIPMLENLNLITLYKGYYISEEDHCKSSIKPLKRLLDLFYELPRVTGVCASRSAEEEVIIRDLKGNQILRVKPKGIGKLKQEIKDYNDMSCSHTISISGYSCKPSYRRIFSEKIDLAGRVYSCGGFQSLPSEMRKQITLDGQKTTEIDIKCLHPNLIACKTGVVLPDHFEHYKVQQGLIQGEYRDVRGLCKKFFMSLLYCETSKKAEVSCRWFVLQEMNKSVDEREYPTINYDVLCVEDVVASLLKTNHYIADVLTSNSLSPSEQPSLLWQQLQFLDSSIMVHVLSTFTALNKPILPYHDSCVVKSEDEELLRLSFKDAWYSVLGTHKNLKLIKEW